MVGMALGVGCIATPKTQDYRIRCIRCIIACNITRKRMLLACQTVRKLRKLDVRDLRKAVDGLVGRVNGKYGKTDYCPIQYVKKKLHHR